MTLMPDTVYPVLHVGVHELPLARLAVHGPASPFVGAADASHALLHTAVLVVSVPAVHVCTLCNARCWNSEGHVGGQRERRSIRGGDGGKGEGWAPGGWRKDEGCQVEGEGG